MIQLNVLKTAFVKLRPYRPFFSLWTITKQRTNVHTQDDDVGTST